MKQYTGWHFLADPGKLRDGTPLQQVVSLPQGVRPVLCEVGFHASRGALAALNYAPGPWLCRVRLGGAVLMDTDKAVAARRALLAGPVDVSRELRLFACDCAERVLPIFEREHPGDARPREAIAVARRFAEGKATVEERAAAWAAAWAAGWDAAGDAAWDAGWAAGWAAAGGAERAWQERELSRAFRAALEGEG